MHLKSCNKQFKQCSISCHLYQHSIFQDAHNLDTHLTVAKSRVDIMSFDHMSWTRNNQSKLTLIQCVCSDAYLHLPLLIKDSYLNQFKLFTFPLLPKIEINLHLPVRRGLLDICVVFTCPTSREYS